MNKKGTSFLWVVFGVMISVVVFWALTGFIFPKDVSRSNNNFVKTGNLVRYGKGRGLKQAFAGRFYFADFANRGRWRE